MEVGVPAQHRLRTVQFSERHLSQEGVAKVQEAMLIDE